MDLAALNCTCRVLTRLSMAEMRALVAFMMSVDGLGFGGTGLIVGGPAPFVEEGLDGGTLCRASRLRERLSGATSRWRMEPARWERDGTDVASVGAGSDKGDDRGDESLVALGKTDCRRPYMLATLPLLALSLSSKASSRSPPPTADLP
jgi:hypothetical protein